MLDEPFAGIDPKTVAEIQDQIRDLVDRYNIGILLTDHQFRETLEVTDRCYVIREGRVFAYGDREQILNNPDVRRYYIGERFDVGHLLERRRPVSLSHHHQAQPHLEPDTDDSPARATATESAYPSIPPTTPSRPRRPRIGVGIGRRPRPPRGRSPPPARIWRPTSTRTGARRSCWARS